jgi:hypothetical protein
MALVAVERLLRAYGGTASSVGLVVGTFNFVDGTKKCYDTHIEDPDMRVKYYPTCSYKCSMHMPSNHNGYNLTWPSVILSSIAKGSYYGLFFPAFFWNVGKDLQRENWSERVSQYYTFTYEKR